MSAAGSGVAAALAACVRNGGVAVFPTDTVYGLGCDPRSPTAVARLHALKGRDATRHKPAAIAFFSLDQAFSALPGLGARTAAAMAALMPGPVTLLIADDQRRFPLADGERLGVRVIDSPTGDPGVALLQSSANFTGAPDVRNVADVPDAIRHGADLVIDGGELPGLASTVVDIGTLDADGNWQIVRQGALDASHITRALAPLVGS